MFLKSTRKHRITHVDSLTETKNAQALTTVLNNGLVGATSSKLPTPVFVRCTRKTAIMVGRERRKDRYIRYTSTI